MTKLLIFKVFPIHKTALLSTHIDEHDINARNLGFDIASFIIIDLLHYQRMTDGNWINLFSYQKEG